MKLLGVLLTGIFSLLLLFLFTKLMGNKQISQMTMFDYITGITIGSIAAELATELEDPLLPTVAMVLYGVVALAISFCTIKSNKARLFFTGKPVILMQDGKLSRKKLKKARLDINEFLAMARLAGFFDLSQLDSAVFEQNGNVSFLPKANYRPANPDDMKLPVKDEGILVNVIVDGNVMEQELRAYGKDMQWLKEQLKQHHQKSPQDIFLATADKNGKLTLFPMEE